MAPIKFEDHIREQLQERELTPSNEAWSNLEKQLHPEASKNKKGFNWFAIAAIFIGVLLLATLLFNSNTSTISNPEIVIEEPENNLLIQSNIPEVVSQEELKNEESDYIETISLAAEETLSIEKENKISPTPKNQEDSIAFEPVIESNKTTETNDVPEDNQVAQVVAQVEALQNNNEVVTEEDIDALLVKAQQELTINDLTKHKKVDAAALLEVVEIEIETTFRDKVYEALGEGYQKVRTAVVSRKN